ncbi:MAG TPA: ABC transporter permease [Candidatus Dormibacteraeota bacterium]|nr:ABC transporter permease [Candidatus Dormibacteraeota bacterium]
MATETSRAGRFYRALLRLLPFDFRSDFGPEMEAVFHEQREEAGRKNGRPGVLRLWWETVAGIFRTAPAEHWAMFRQDAGFALRMMRKNPGFTLAAILTLGLGIGANSAIFSVVNAVLLRPLPYEHGDRLITIRQQAPTMGLLDQPFSVPEIMDYRAQNRSLDALVEYHQMNFILLGRSEPERVDTGVVSWNYFDEFGMKPLVGRAFRAEDEQPGAPAVLLLSYEYWLRSFGGDPTVVGKSFTMNDKIHTVVGVLPPIPQYPNENDVYMPTTACPFRSGKRMIESRTSRMMNVFGRMKPGVEVRQAQADLASVAANLQKTYPDAYPANSGYTVRSSSLREELTHNARPTMLTLLAAAGFVLLIACANVANLNLARMVKRERELAVRAAMGAGRVRMFRQLLTESFLLAVIGGGLGLLISWGGLHLLVSFAARFTPRAREIHMDGAVLAFTLVVAVLTSVLSGTAPAAAAREALVSSLKEGSGQSTMSRGRRRLRGLLIVSQVAFSFLLLIGAGLMLRSFMKLQQVDAGFHPENVLTMRLGLNFTKYNSDDKQRAFFETLLDKISAQPGVNSAAASMTVPLGDAMRMTGDFQIEGETPAPGQSLPVGHFRIVSPSYFDVLRIPLLAGRVFTKADRPNVPVVSVISSTAARRFWPGKDPIGKRFSPDGGSTWAQIVGVVGDVHEYGLNTAPVEALYIPLAQNPLSDGSLIIKTAGEPMGIARRVIELIYEIDPNQPAARIRSLEQVRADSVAAPRLTANLLGLFALLALAIAAAGIGGVMALVVNQRKQEIGVRMAMGARPGAILRMVLGQGLALALLGIGIGLVGALGLTRVLNDLLFEVQPTDPVTFAGVAAVLAFSALAACYIPARRAASVDPIVALRSE